jgi:hypothetical protein
MALVHNNNLSVFQGVSKQAIDMRLPSYCEEMINCYPSIENGVRRRNPTMLVSSNVTATRDQFTYSYDRGLSGESSEQYMITIDKVNNLKVFDINANTYRTVSYTGNALKYLCRANFKKSKERDVEKAAVYLSLAKKELEVSSTATIRDIMEGRR